MNGLKMLSLASIVVVLIMYSNSNIGRRVCDDDADLIHKLLN